MISKLKLGMEEERIRKEFLRYNLKTNLYILHIKEIDIFF
jgi:hypothetical protein